MNNQPFDRDRCESVKNPESDFVKSTRNHKTAVICLFSVFSIYSVYGLKKCIKINFSKKALNTAIKIIKKNWKTTIKKLERDNKDIIEETIGSEST